MHVIAILFALILAYILGSVSGSLLLGRLLGQSDVRASGSGNAGATNALRTGGIGYGAAVLLFDLLKGLLAAGVVPQLLAIPEGWAFLCGFLAILGHVYPILHGFRGGKGAATGIGVLSVLLPGGLILGGSIWVAILVATGYVGLATVMGMIGVALSSLLVPGISLAGQVFVLATTLLIVYTHRGNLQRVREGTENRFEKARIWRR